MSRLLAQLTTQADVLVPLLRAFREEIGTERANEIAWRALAAARREQSRNKYSQFTGSARERWNQIGSVEGPDWVGDAIETQLVEDSDSTLAFNVTACQFADLFRQLGEPELGFALTCAGDRDLVADVGQGDIEFERAATIMQGAKVCDFRYRFREPACAPITIDSEK